MNKQIRDNILLSRQLYRCAKPPAETALSPLDRLLGLLENVRPDGGGWRARCPAHEGKHDISLALSTNKSGSLILHCIGYCGPLDVIHALGLELSDLYPNRETKDIAAASKVMT